MSEKPGSDSIFIHVTIFLKCPQNSLA